MGYDVNEVYTAAKYKNTKRKVAIKSGIRRLANRIVSDLGYDYLELDAFVTTFLYYMKSATEVKDIDEDEVRSYIEDMFGVTHGYIYVNDKKFFAKVTSWSLLYLLWRKLEDNKLYKTTEILDLIKDEFMTDVYGLLQRLKWLNSRNAVVKLKIGRDIYWGLPPVSVELDEKFERVEGQMIYVG